MWPRRPTAIRRSSAASTANRRFFRAWSRSSTAGRFTGRGMPARTTEENRTEPSETRVFLIMIRTVKAGLLNRPARWLVDNAPRQSGGRPGSGRHTLDGAHAFTRSHTQCGVHTGNQVDHGIPRSTCRLGFIERSVHLQVHAVDIAGAIIHLGVAVDVSVLGDEHVTLVIHVTLTILEHCLHMPYTLQFPADAL